MADRGFVIHDQQGPLGRNHHLPCRIDRAFCNGRGVAPGQIQADRGALARLGEDPDRSSRLPREAVDHRQPQPCSMAHRLGGVERLEGARNGLLRHAGARIGDAQRHIAARRKIPLPGCRLFKLDIGCPDGQPAAFGHGIAGVDAQVQDGVLQLRSIDLRMPQMGCRHDVDVHAGAHGPAQQVLPIGQERGHIGGLGVQDLPARERKQPLRERGGAPHRPLRSMDEAREVVHLAARQHPLQQLQIAHDGRQQVVEVVRKAARQLAHGLHLLRLAQLLLHLGQRFGLGHFGGDVAAHRIDAACRRTGGPGDPAVAPVPMAIPVVKPGMRHACGQLLRVLDGARQILRMDEMKKRGAQQLVFTPAQYLGPGRVDRSDDALERAAHHDVG